MIDATPLARKTNLVIQAFEDELLIFDLQLNKAFCLNETASSVWRNSNGKNSISDITNNLSNEFGKPVSEDFVWIAIDQLYINGLLENGEIVERHFPTVSRRKIIREVGFGSMLALPSIAAVVAPSAAMAQSACFANLTACTTNSDCCSGNCFTSPPSGSRCCNAGVSNFVPLVTCFCAAPGACNGSFAQATCCATGTATQEPFWPGGFCGPGAVLCGCDGEPRCF